jgi:hypothetical protein
MARLLLNCIDPTQSGAWCAIGLGLGAHLKRMEPARTETENHVSRIGNPPLACFR